MAPPMFGRATIRLGIGPHSSDFFIVKCSSSFKQHVSLIIQFVGPCRRRVWSTNTPLCRIEPFADSAVQTVNHRRSSVSGRSSTVLEQSARQRHVSQFVVGFPAATETHTVPAVIPRHYHVTFLNCNTHSGLAVALLLRPL